MVTKGPFIAKVIDGIIVIWWYSVLGNTFCSYRGDKFFFYNNVAHKVQMMATQ